MSKKKDKKKTSAVIKATCPVCKRRSELIQDMFFDDVYNCSKCAEEVCKSELA